MVDVEALLTEIGISSPPTGTKASSTDSPATIEHKADQIRSILATLLTPGLNPGIDRICYDQLKIPMTHTVFGLVTYVINLLTCKLRYSPLCLEVTMQSP